MKRFLTICFLISVLAVNGQVDAGEDAAISAGIPYVLQGTFIGFFGEPVTAQDDYFVGPFDIGFDFVYFGSAFSQFAISPNGLVSFEVPGIIGLSYWEPSMIPNDLFKKTIMGPYQDLFTRPIEPHSRFIYYKTIGETPGRKLVVGWCEAPMFNCNDKNSTFQIVLNETSNIIENHLTIKPECLANYDNKGTHGLNFDENTGVVIPGRNWEAFTANEESWRFTPSGSEDYDFEEITFEPEIVVPENSVSWKWFESSYPGGREVGSLSTVTVAPLETTTYYAEITLCGGQKYVDEVVLTVIPVPNAFNPNSRIEENRRFRLLADPPENAGSYMIYIYNRWGELVYESDDMEEGWDGTFQGKLCPSGVYVWVIYLETGEEKLTNKGFVTLVR